MAISQTKKIVTLTALGYISLWFVPLLLQILGVSPKLEIDWEGLNEEWFKVLSDIGKILFSFALVNMYWEKYKKASQEAEKRNILMRMLSRWIECALSLKRSLNGLQQSVEEGRQADYNKFRKELTRGQADLSMLSNSISTFSDEFVAAIHDKLLALIISFNESMNRCLVDLLRSMEEGELIPGRMSEADKRRIAQLQAYFFDVAIASQNMLNRRTD